MILTPNDHTSRSVGKMGCTDKESRKVHSGICLITAMPIYVAEISATPLTNALCVSFT